MGGDGGPAVPAPGSKPVRQLNERAQTGVIADLTYTQDATGSAHRPVFTCTASCNHATDRYVSSAEDASKSAAKAAAAVDLLEQVRHAERAHLARLAQVRREQARSSEGIVARLLQAGHDSRLAVDAYRM